MEPGACHAAIIAVVEGNGSASTRSRWTNGGAPSRSTRVQECYDVTGRTYFLLSLVVPDMSAYERFIAELCSGSCPGPSGEGSSSGKLLEPRPVLKRYGYIEAAISLVP